MSLVSSLFSASVEASAGPVMPASPVMALALRRHTRSHRILLGDLIELVAIVKMAFFKPRAMEKAKATREYVAELERQKAIAKGRVILDESKLDPVTGKATEPLVVCVPIVPKAIRAQQGRRRGEIIGWSASAWIEIPQKGGGVIEVEAVPLVKQKMGLIERDEEGGWQTTGEHYFIVLAPEFKTEKVRGEDGTETEEVRHSYHKLVPLGAANAELLETLNALHVRDGNLDQIVLPINHDIRKPGTSRTIIYPSCDEPARDDAQRRMIGRDCGVVMITTPRSPPPPKDQETGRYLPVVADYRETEGRMVVEILGTPDRVSVEVRKFRSEMDYVMDPTALTGLDINTIDPDDVEASFKELRDLPADASNPVWRALAMNPDPEDNLLNHETDELFFQIEQVEEALNTAAMRIKAMLDSAFADAIHEFMSIPELSELIEGDDVETALAKMEGEDGAVVLVRKELGAFDWTRPMHRKVRRWLIERTAGRVAAPEPKVVVKKPTKAKSEKPTYGIKLPYKGKIFGQKKLEIDSIVLLGLTGQTWTEIFAEASMQSGDTRVAEATELINEQLLLIPGATPIDLTDDGHRKQLEGILGKARMQVVNKAREMIAAG